jgi:hypothetical protein
MIWEYHLRCSTDSENPSTLSHIWFTGATSITIHDIVILSPPPLAGETLAKRFLSWLPPLASPQSKGNPAEQTLEESCIPSFQNPEY